MSIRSRWLIMLFRSSVYFLIFCLFDPSHTERGVLKSPTIIEDLSIPPFGSTRFCLTYLDDLLGSYTLRIFALLENWSTYHTSFKKDLVAALEFIIYIFKNGLSPIQIALYYSTCSTGTLWQSTVFPIPLSCHLWHYGLHFTNPYVIVIW